MPPTACYLSRTIFVPSDELPEYGTNVVRTWYEQRPLRNI